jgi:hypothetical protein
MNMKKVSQTLKVNSSQAQVIRKLFKFFGYYLDLAETADIFATYLYCQYKDDMVTKEVWVEILPDYKTDNFNFNIVYEKYKI